MKKTIALALIGSALFLFACKNDDTEDMDDAISNMSQSLVESINDGTSGLTSTGQTDLSFNDATVPSMLVGKSERFVAALKNLFIPASLYAADGSWTCPGGGTVSYTDPSTTWNSSNTSFTITRTFNACKSALGYIQIDGTSTLECSNMKGTSGKQLQNGSTIKQIPSDKTFRNTATGYYMTVSGNGSNGVAHTLTWQDPPESGYDRTFTLATDLTWRGYTPKGIKFFEHIVKTTTPYTINVKVGNSRTIKSGTVEVSYALANITVTSTISNLVMGWSSCIPSTGSINFTVSGSRTGSGTISFANGLAQFTYTASSGNSISGEFAVSGCH